ILVGQRSERLRRHVIAVNHIDAIPVGVDIDLGETAQKQAAAPAPTRIARRPDKTDVGEQMSGVVAELEPSGVDASEGIGASGSFDGNAGADGGGAVHIQQTLKNNSEVANVAGAAKANCLQLGVNAADERHADFDARPAVEEGLFETERVAIN